MDAQIYLDLVRGLSYTPPGVGGSPQKLVRKCLCFTFFSEICPYEGTSDTARALPTLMVVDGRGLMQGIPKLSVDVRPKLGRGGGK